TAKATAPPETKATAQTAATPAAKTEVKTATAKSAPMPNTETAPANENETVNKRTVNPNDDTSRETKNTHCSTEEPQRECIRGTDAKPAPKDCFAEFLDSTVSKSDDKKNSVIPNNFAELLGLINTHDNLWISDQTFRYHPNLYIVFLTALRASSSIPAKKQVKKKSDPPEQLKLMFLKDTLLQWAGIWKNDKEKAFQLYVTYSQLHRSFPRDTEIASCLKSVTTHLSGKTKSIPANGAAKATLCSLHSWFEIQTSLSQKNLLPSDSDLFDKYQNTLLKTIHKSTHSDDLQTVRELIKDLIEIYLSKITARDVSQKKKTAFFANVVHILYSSPEDLININDCIHYFIHIYIFCIDELQDDTTTQAVNLTRNSILYGKKLEIRSKNDANTLYLIQAMLTRLSLSLHTLWGNSRDREPINTAFLEMLLYYKRSNRSMETIIQNEGSAPPFEKMQDSGMGTFYPTNLTAHVLKSTTAFLKHFTTFQRMDKFSKNSVFARLLEELRIPPRESAVSPTSTFFARFYACWGDKSLDEKGPEKGKTKAMEHYSRSIEFNPLIGHSHLFRYYFGRDDLNALESVKQLTNTCYLNPSDCKNMIDFANFWVRSNKSDNAFVVLTRIIAFFNDQKKPVNFVIKYPDFVTALFDFFYLDYIGSLNDDNQPATSSTPDTTSPAASALQRDPSVRGQELLNLFKETSLLAYILEGLINRANKMYHFSNSKLTKEEIKKLISVYQLVIPYLALSSETSRAVAVIYGHCLLLDNQTSKATQVFTDTVKENPSDFKMREDILQIYCNTAAMDLITRPKTSPNRKELLKTASTFIDRKYMLLVFSHILFFSLYKRMTCDNTVIHGNKKPMKDFQTALTFVKLFHRETRSETTPNTPYDTAERDRSEQFILNELLRFIDGFFDKITASQNKLSPQGKIMLRDMVSILKSYQNYNDKMKRILAQKNQEFLDSIHRLQLQPLRFFHYIYDEFPQDIFDWHTRIISSFLMILGPDKTHGKNKLDKIRLELVEDQAEKDSERAEEPLSNDDCCLMGLGYVFAHDYCQALTLFEKAGVPDNSQLPSVYHIAYLVSMLLTGGNIGINELLDELDHFFTIDTDTDDFTSYNTRKTTLIELIHHHFSAPPLPTRRDPGLFLNQLHEFSKTLVSDVHPQELNYSDSFLRALEQNTELHENKFWQFTTLILMLMTPIENHFEVYQNYLRLILYKESDLNLGP
ncbi:hypothetical protein ACFL96_10150, partial [Thermoproteota archaeon]